MDIHAPVFDQAYKATHSTTKFVKIRELRSSGLLRSEWWQFLTDVSGQPIVPSSVVKMEPTGGPKTSVKTQKSAVLICFAVEAWNHVPLRHISILSFRTSKALPQISGVPRNFILGGGGATSSVEDRGEREWGSGGGSPLVRGSGGSCNLVQEISFHIVKFS